MPVISNRALLYSSGSGRESDNLYQFAWEGATHHTHERCSAVTYDLQADAADDVSPSSGSDLG